MERISFRCRRGRRMAAMFTPSSKLRKSALTRNMRCRSLPDWTPFMLLALLSDTHDNAANTLAALDLLAPYRPQAYLHAGYLVGVEMLVHFSGLPFHFVFGNNEYDHAGLRSRAKALDFQCHGQLADLTFEGKRLAMMHGHDAGLLQKLVGSGQYDYVVHGHTH